MLSLSWIVLIFCVLNGTLAKVDEKIPKIIIVGAGAAGISSAAKVLENGFNDVTILEAQDRIGGRVNSIPFGKGFIDLGAQWCQGEVGNVIYETLHNVYEFGDTGFSFEKSLFYTSQGSLADQSKSIKLMKLSEKIYNDLEAMAKSNKSLAEFFEENYRMELQKQEFEDIDEELADQFLDSNRRQTTSFYAASNWMDISAKLNAVTDA
ncbi:Protein anon-37Cs, partial [Pseudolycoriella hygida]